MDINEILSSLSSDDIEQLKEAANSILGGSEQKQSNEPSLADMNLFNPAVLSNLGMLSKALSGDDDRTALIKALKPMLCDERKQKADEAIKILKLLQLMPLLQESGLLKGLL